MDVNYLIRQLPLKDMGEALLVAEIEYRAEYLETPNSDIEIKMAIRLASYLHRDQRRSNRGTLPKDTYITHPLRNCLRLMRYGVTDKNILVAAILHDTVEDCEDDIIMISGYTILNTPEGRRAAALRWLGFEFGPETVRLVEGVTNPVQPEGPQMSKDEKRKFYQSHVRERLVDPKIAVVKLTDFVDNAVGLYHNTAMLPQARFHLASKYLPLVDDFADRIQEQDVIDILTPHGFAEAALHLVKGDKELTSILAEPDSGV